MPGLDGLAAAAALRAEAAGVPGARSSPPSAGPGTCAGRWRPGALGFVVKDAPAEQLADAVRRVAAGVRVVDPALAAATLAGGASPLTGRERDVLVAARGGATVADIAARAVPLRGHGAQLPVLGDRQDRRAQPRRGRAGRRRARLALMDPGLRRVEVAGRAVAYRRAGAGPPVMLLHSGWSDGRQWLGQLERLSDAFDVVAWDAPGCGGSADPPPGADLGAYADALAGLAGALGLRRPHLCGLSWGGALAPGGGPPAPEAGAVARPGRRVRRLGGLAGAGGGPRPPGPRGRRGAQAPEEWAAGYLDGFFAGPVGDDVRDAQLRMVLDVRPAGLVAMIRAMAAADLRPVLPELDVPVLVIHGGRDARSSPDVGRALHAAIPGARLVELPGVGHVVNMEAPAAFEGELRAFLTSVPG